MMLSLGAETKFCARLGKGFIRFQGLVKRKAINSEGTETAQRKTEPNQQKHL